MKIAQATVKANLAKVLTLADRLTEHGQIEAADFCCRAEAARVSTADTPQRRTIGALETKGIAWPRARIRSSLRALRRIRD
jgi:hypothetical protein